MDRVPGSKSVNDFRRGYRIACEHTFCSSVFVGSVEHSTGFMSHVTVIAFFGNVMLWSTFANVVTSGKELKIMYLQES